MLSESGGGTDRLPHQVKGDRRDHSPGSECPECRAPVRSTPVRSTPVRVARIRCTPVRPDRLWGSAATDSGASQEEAQVAVDSRRIVVLIIIIAVATSGGSDDSSPSGSQNGSAQNAPANGGGEQAAGLNTPVRDGKFEFVVTGVEKGLASVGDNPYLTEQAQGQFVVVTMTVKNISDKAYGFSPSDQKLLDAQGREFEPSTSAQIALGGSDIPVWDNINPGNTVIAKVSSTCPRTRCPPPSSCTIRCSPVARRSPWADPRKPRRTGVRTARNGCADTGGCRHEEGSPRM